MTDSRRIDQLYSAPDAAAAERAASEIAMVDAALGSIASAIEHIGSTAVPGLGGKRTIAAIQTLGDLGT